MRRSDFFVRGGAMGEDKKRDRPIRDLDEPGPPRPVDERGPPRPNVEKRHDTNGDVPTPPRPPPPPPDPREKK